MTQPYCLAIGMKGGHVHTLHGSVTVMRTAYGVLVDAITADGSLAYLAGSSCSSRDLPMDLCVRPPHVVWITLTIGRRVKV